MNRTTRKKLIVTIGVAAMGLTFLVYSVLANSGSYRMVDDLLKDLATNSDSLMERKLQVHGWVVPGSIKEWIENQETRRTFELERNGKRVQVENRGPKPDNFADQSEVIATGRLEKRGAAYVLISDKLDAKCPSKYEGAASQRTLAENPQFH